MLSLSLTACGGGSGSAAQSGGNKVQGGVVTDAEIASSPNFIFPLAPATNTDGYNENLTQPMWPYIAYEGDVGQTGVNPVESLYSSITWSDSDKTITIVFKPWDWSDGTPITSRDFTFVYNLLKAEASNWVDYVPGLFPDNVTSVTTPNTHTAVVQLSRSFNPTFYLDNVFTLVPLMPQHAWDKTSTAGPVGNYDETTAGAKAVWTYLQAQGGQEATFSTNPLWKVVDGPWMLTSFKSTGYYSYAPNSHYSGADKPTLSQWILTPYTTDTAELDSLRAGGALDFGQLPLNDVQQEQVLKEEGYSIEDQVVPGVAFIQPNLYNAQVGPMLRQLYVRQAMEYLINRPQIVKDIYDGYADPGNGPVPTRAFPNLVSSDEQGQGEYPFDPSKGISLLKAHGWKVTPNGVSTCAVPGTGSTQCGADIAAGQKLEFTLAYSSGTTATDEQEAAIQSTEEQAGVKLNLDSEPFNTLVAQLQPCTAASHPASNCAWQLDDEGYDPYQLDPTGGGFFNTNGVNNEGGYSSPVMDNLINQTEYGSSQATFSDYENYATTQLPWLWLPDPDYLNVYKSTLHGVVPANPFSGGLNPEIWYYTSGS
jgi:peptide/nickel transport system substrate-binding protein